jgi:hypothetical protein
MQPTVSPEMLHGAVEMVVYVFTLLTAVWTFVLAARE